MTDETVEIIRAAVRLAKNEQIKRLSTLRARLLDIYPGKDGAIEEALAAWARYAKN